MRKPILKIGIAFLAVALLAGCGGNPTSEEPVLTEAQYDYALNEIAKTVPLVVERTTGVTIHTNIYRNSLEPKAPLPILKDGNDLILTTGGTLNIENEDANMFIYNDYTINWNYAGEGDEAATTAPYAFSTDDKGVMTAAPGYPEYVQEYDGGGRPIPVDMPSPKIGRLYATVKIGELAKRITIDMQLNAIEKINFYTLPQVRELNAGTVAGVRGYVTGIFADWNNAGIADGKWGLGLFKLADYKDTIRVGDLIEVVGQQSVYGGLTQLQWLKRIKVLNPADYPEVAKPEVQTFTHDQIKDQLGRAEGDLTGPLQDKDSSLVKFDAPFTFKEVKDRSGAIIPLENLDPAGTAHYDIVVEGKTSEGVTFPVSISLNYHMGADSQKGFKDFFVANGTKPFYYEGPLGWYGGVLNFGPFQFEGTLTLA